MPLISACKQKHTSIPFSERNWTEEQKIVWTSPKLQIYNLQHEPIFTSFRFFFETTFTSIVLHKDVVISTEFQIKNLQQSSHVWTQSKGMFTQSIVYTQSAHHAKKSKKLDFRAYWHTEARLMCMLWAHVTWMYPNVPRACTIPWKVSHFDKAHVMWTLPFKDPRTSKTWSPIWNCSM